ncbi:hypothetical protein FGO68_gene16983 [Halteria grandinella]|uniref:Uncharacterized protein n=1 Tax=Halteria grandinella TaxID=5974 RepID=A0A8J8P4J1_HALGN|nr:hypothetical protein FGO68_gene16983 [Halteria grandinella]
MAVAQFSPFFSEWIVSMAVPMVVMVVVVMGVLSSTGVKGKDRNDVAPQAYHCCDQHNEAIYLLGVDYPQMSMMLVRAPSISAL